MSFEQLTLFIPIALVLAAAPGPDNLGVVALGISHGRSASLGFALGCASGCINHTLLAIIGVSALIAASSTAFHIMQYCGAAYLAWLGLRILMTKQTPNIEMTPDIFAVTTFGVQFRKGLIANSINPKVALFFLAFLPQFVRPGSWPSFLQLAIFGILFTLCSALVFAAIALFSAHIGSWFRSRPNAMLWAERASGLMFIGLALRLALMDISSSQIHR